MQGNKKLKDIFIDKKIPVELRDKIPLVCDEQGIIWIAGIQQSDFYTVNKHSKHIIYLNLKKLIRWFLVMTTMQEDIKSVLFSEEQLQAGVKK